jgi:hypothetical protein
VAEKLSTGEVAKNLGRPIHQVQAVLRLLTYADRIKVLIVGKRYLIDREDVALIERELARHPNWTRLPERVPAA